MGLGPPEPAGPTRPAHAPSSIAVRLIPVPLTRAATGAVPARPPRRQRREEDKAASSPTPRPPRLPLACSAPLAPHSSPFPLLQIHRALPPPSLHRGHGQRPPWALSSTPTRPPSPLCLADVFTSFAITLLVFWCHPLELGASASTGSGSSSTSSRRQSSSI